MNYPLPADLEQLVQDEMAWGGYASEEDVLRRALVALRERREDLAAIQEGIDDLEAGRVRPIEEVVDEIRARHGFAPET
ncbi:MAG: type II toxin-antitoxin system ParD family antitoxin [Planctomycetia bacterium]|nr:type II toxin-antitoxin system ParD family antitoxin [Planctomycetia bacterium]